MSNIIEINGITKMFGNETILDDLSLSVEQGSFHALIGENGSGKTTLIKAILNLFPDVQGIINIDGINNLEKESRESLYYFPADVKFPRFVSLYNFLFGIYKLHETNNGKIHVELVDMLRKMNLWKVRRNNPNKFSSGQKKKVYLIMALIRRPKLFILDEPTANLDPNTRREFYSVLQNLKENGSTIFVSINCIEAMQAHFQTKHFKRQRKGWSLESLRAITTYQYSVLNGDSVEIQKSEQLFDYGWKECQIHWRPFRE